MENHVYKVVELVGTSDAGVEAAIDKALERAGETLRHIRWFEVVQVRGQLESGKVTQYQAILKVGFTLD